MRLLKSFLYTVLFVCIFWGLLIFTGPKLIEVAVYSRLGEAVKLTDVKVSPKLSVSASRIDMSSLNVGDLEIYEGSMRAVKLSWKNFFSARPILTMSAAYANFDEDVKLGSFSLDLQPKANFSFSEVLAQMKLENLAVGNVFFTSRAKFDADVDIDTLILKNSYFSLQNFEASNMFKVNSNLVVGSLKSWKIFSKLAFQDTSLDMSFDGLDLRSKSEEFAVEKLNVQGEIKSNMLELNIEAKSGVFESGIRMNEFNLMSVTRNLSEGLGLIDVNFTLNDLLLPSPDPNEAHKEVRFLSGAVVRDAENLGKISLQGTLGAFEIFSQNQILANISEATIAIEGKIVDAEKVYSRLSVVKKDFIPANFVGNLIFENEFEDLIDCALNGCLPENLNANYEIDIEGNRLVGTLRCKMSNCLNNPSIHTLETMDTQKFFQSLVKTNILNPIISIIFYNSILSGKKTENGNIVNF